MQQRDGRLTFSPSDLSAYLACEHLTQLERRVALGRATKPAVENPEAELVRRKGEEHEAAYLDGLRAQGLRIAEIELGDELDWARGARETVEAMRAGVDAVYQGVFVEGDWRGIADFLERKPDGTYEAMDTKLARNARPRHILQLCFYTEQLARIQGREPAEMHVVLGSGERLSFRPQDFGAYYRRVRQRFVDFASFERETEPYPVSHCSICDFLPRCEAQWERADHLSQVARLYRRHYRLLREAGVDTLEGLAHAHGVVVDGLEDAVLDRLRDQASLQLYARETGRAAFRLLQPVPETGLALLPPPSEGDVFFDLEGDPFWDADGSLEYLWGVLDADGFTALRAHDRATEREAFERFVDLVHERLARDPALHVYHYAPYEVTVLRRLMGRYGSREREVDDLLRRGVLVDLYAVVRNGVRVSEPRYGLKNLEVFLPLERRAEIKEGGTSIVRFEEWVRTRDPAILDEIEHYNREDCEATRLLRDWLLERQREALDRFGTFPLPEPEESREPPEKQVERAPVREALLARGEELAAHLLDYHDRERKPVWWAFFDRIEMTPADLVEDAEAIGLLELVSGPEEVTKQSKAWTFTFPPQEHKLGQGQDVVDPATRDRAGVIAEIDRDARRLVLKRGPKLEDVVLPKALVPGSPFLTRSQEDALLRLGRALLAGDGRYRALESVLRRTPFSRPVQTTDLDEMERLLLSLDRGHLFIQGPPGSGKTWTGGRLIVRLLRAGKRVGIASTSHKAIHNVLRETELAGLDVPACKKASSGNPESFYEGTLVENETDVAACLDYQLAAGTAWLFADPRFDGTLDYLFVDEAGQVALADALAMGTSARNLVLLGDPNQLPQVLQGTHPEGSAASVLEHLLGEELTVPADRGLFLERTFRLHPDVCGYISEAFYEGRLEPDSVTAERTTPFGTGLRYVPVEHEQRRQESPEEAAAVLALVERLLAAGVRAPELLVVAPYNAHVNLLREVLRDRVRVGTVDKFQGQEGDVVVYSLASSSGLDIPRSLEFLFSRNRLNVAVSRARCLAYLVCSPRLLEVDARTVEHMRLANALCRFVELADPVVV